MVLPIKPRTVKTVRMVKVDLVLMAKMAVLQPMPTKMVTLILTSQMALTNQTIQGHLAMVVMALPALTAKMLIIQTLIVTRATVLTINLMINNRLVMILVPMTIPVTTVVTTMETILMGLKTPPQIPTMIKG